MIQINFIFLKVMERGENSFNEQTEDLRILKIEIRRLR